MDDHENAMTVREAIFTRRAMRAFEPRAVDEPILRGLLEAAVYAPSAMNLQPWLFAIVQDREQLRRYSDRAKALVLEQAATDPKVRHYAPMLRDPEYNIFYDAGTLVVIGVREPGPFAQADGWLAAQNLMLAACAVGLGTCCIGFALAVLDTPDVRRELEIPSGAVVVAPIIVGWPRAKPAPVSRRTPTIVSWSGRPDGTRSSPGQR